MKSFDEKQLQKEIIIDAKGVGIPIGAAEIFAAKTTKAAQKSLKPKTIITNQDLKRAVVKELKKYNPDLAYVYKIRDKII